MIDGEISDEEGKLETERLLDLRLANPKEIAVTLPMSGGSGACLAVG